MTQMDNIVCDIMKHFYLWKFIFYHGFILSIKTVISAEFSFSVFSYIAKQNCMFNLKDNNNSFALEYHTLLLL